MQRSNRHLGQSAAFVLVAIVTFLNASCSSKISTRDYLVVRTAAASSNENIQSLIIGVLPTQSLEGGAEIEPLVSLYKSKVKTEAL